MTSNHLSLIQWASILFIILPIVILWVNNRFLSARKPSSQVLLGITLVAALAAAEMSSAVALIISAVCLAVYLANLVQYYVAAMECSRKHDVLPPCKRP